MGEVAGGAGRNHSLAKLGTGPLDYASQIIATHLGWHPQDFPTWQPPLCLSGESPALKPKIVADTLGGSQALEPESQVMGLGSFRGS